ncbi:hypothetical protein [Rosistilla oblonga]|uniref:hypothetical protein n=1 Tax=Rosistilla oblonga TaxID=2527990 RepID=UPI003A97E0C2
MFGIRYLVMKILTNVKAQEIAKDAVARLGEAVGKITTRDVIAFIAGQASMIVAGLIL